jgi:hypothetical protein
MVGEGEEFRKGGRQNILFRPRRRLAFTLHRIGIHLESFNQTSGLM